MLLTERDQIVYLLTSEQRDELRIRQIRDRITSHGLSKISGRRNAKIGREAATLALAHMKLIILYGESRNQNKN